MLVCPLQERQGVHVRRRRLSAAAVPLSNVAQIQKAAATSQRPLSTRFTRPGTSPMPKNEAAWLVAKHDLLQVGEAPYPEPAAGEIVVRNHAVAVNPVDWIV